MPLADLVRRHDPDRYFCTLFAPAAAREALFTLYAFNHELARAREVAREPGLALIRLQWWHEVVEGAVRQHEVAQPLAALIAEGVLPAPLLRSMIEMREAEAVEPPATLAVFLSRMQQGPGALAQAAGTVLGGEALARLGALGAAYGVAGTLRNVAALARQERCVLPLDLLEAAGMSEAQAIAAPAEAEAAVRPDFLAAARQLRGRRRRVPRAVLAAALPAVLARRDLAHGVPAASRGLADRVAVLWGAVTSRI
jgi:phytoene synthase